MSSLASSPEITADSHAAMMKCLRAAWSGQAFSRFWKFCTASHFAIIGLINSPTGDRKSTRLTPVTNAHLVCRLLLENKQHLDTVLLSVACHRLIIQTGVPRD